MPLHPEDWNVVVAGRWNTALFTPAAVTSRVFKLPSGTPVEVLVVIDDVQMPRVKHNGMIVAPSVGQLVISPERCTLDELARAMTMAREAISELPNTPYTAAGFNLRYRSAEMPRSLAERFSDDIDHRFSDYDFEIVGRQFHRLVKFESGRLLVQVRRDPDGKAELLMNFECRSKEAAQLLDWLSISIEKIRAAATKVLAQVLELQEDDYVIERNEHAIQHEGISAASGD